ncbi:hypothetical protein SDC9_98673 [bioreactor metagenome]|uniref:BioF2-like acetyltransferase domain-containing protein n=1 Tax=bioreactor metagenome TaxID=1076179 RepID=A0A645AI12_9ZZZZ
MQFKIYNNIWSVKAYWLQLTLDKDNSIFQQYDFNKLFFIYRITSLSNIKKRNISCRFIVGIVKEEVKCIAPLVIDNENRKTLRLLGHGTNAGYLDYIYNDPSYVQPLHDFIKFKYQGFEFDYIFVPVTSPLANIMQSVDEYKNYAITYQSYVDYYAGLSKNTRQNIRTAYNRLTTDNKKFELKVLQTREEIKEETLKALNDLYQKRKQTWTGEVALVGVAKDIFLKRDVVYKAVKSLQNSIIGILYIDGYIASFFIGFTKGKNVCIPRLAIDSDFGRYSPGVVLILEYLKIKEDNNALMFDLCRGDEKYKTTLGGVCTMTYRLR